jgi:hypothetical protein
MFYNHQLKHFQVTDLYDIPPSFVNALTPIKLQFLHFQLYIAIRNEETAEIKE